MARKTDDTYAKEAIEKLIEAVHALRAGAYDDTLIGQGEIVDRLLDEAAVIVAKIDQPLRKKVEV